MQKEQQKRQEKSGRKEATSADVPSIVRFGPHVSPSGPGSLFLLSLSRAWTMFRRLQLRSFSLLFFRLVGILPLVDQSAHIWPEEVHLKIPRKVETV